MDRKPNKDYYPDYSNQDFLIKTEDLALNKENLENNKVTPLSVSSQVAVFTKQYEERVKNKIKPENNVQYDWESEYLNSDLIPQNRWVHETVRKPVMIEEGLYEIYTPADVYFRKGFFEYKNDQERFSCVIPYIDPVTRTLYQHLEIDQEKNKELIFSKQDVDELFNPSSDGHSPFNYFWNIFWIPSYPCDITFYTTKEIEDDIFLKVDPIKVDCSDPDIKSVKVPAHFKKFARKNKAVIKHDTLVMIMKVDKR